MLSVTKGANDYAHSHTLKSHRTTC